jgi:hypothetical protein
VAKRSSKGERLQAFAKEPPEGHLDKLAERAATAHEAHYAALDVVDRTYASHDAIASRTAEELEESFGHDEETLKQQKKRTQEARARIREAEDEAERIEERKLKAIERHRQALREAGLPESKAPVPARPSGAGPKHIHKELSAASREVRGDEKSPRLAKAMQAARAAGMSDAEIESRTGREPKDYIKSTELAGMSRKAAGPSSPTREAPKRAEPRAASPAPTVDRLTELSRTAGMMSARARDWNATHVEHKAAMEAHQEAQKAHEQAGHPRAAFHAEQASFHAEEVEKAPKTPPRATHPAKSAAAKLAETEPEQRKRSGEAKSKAAKLAATDPKLPEGHKVVDHHEKWGPVIKGPRGGTYTIYNGIKYYGDY